MSNPNPSLLATLKRKLSGAQRVCVLAAGSSLRGDDSAGLLVVMHLRQLLHARTDPSREKLPPDPLGGFSSALDHDFDPHHEDHPPAVEEFELARQGGEPLGLQTILGETAPENYTGEIKRFGATHLIIVDAADFGGAVGAVQMIDPYEVDNASMSTHSLPVRVMTDYLHRFLACRFLIVGIQPRGCEFGKPATPEIVAAAGDVAALLLDALAG